MQGQCFTASAPPCILQLNLLGSRMTEKTPVGRICDELSKLARKNHFLQLSAWLKLAANDAYLARLMTDIDVPQLSCEIGVWDWDIANNLVHTDTICGGFFGKSSEAAAAGIPLENYLPVIHPDDRSLFSKRLDVAARTGGMFSADYRIIFGGRLRWVRANGQCTLDRSGRPLRAMGSIVDTTREVDCFSNAPL